MYRRYCRAVVAACLMLVVAATSCNNNGAQVQRSTPQVWAGLTLPVTPTPLGDDQWHDLADGSLVTTDANGEACIQIDNCLKIYVYQDGQFVKAACSRGQGGSAGCSLSGTTAYNNKCADKVVIQTYGAEIHLQGTWVSVTYLPDRQLTLVIVLDGQATVWPVLDVDQWTLGNPVQVDPQQFVLTSPQEPAKLAQPLDRLNPLIQELDIQPWMDRVRAQAEADHLVAWPRPELSGLLVHGEGGLLDDPRVQEAIAYAVPWAELQARLFAGQEMPMMLSWPGREVDARTLKYEPDVARKLLAEAGDARGFGLTLYCYAATDDIPLLELAQSVIRHLDAAGIGAKLMVLGEGTAAPPGPTDAPVLVLRRAGP